MCVCVCVCTVFGVYPASLSLSATGYIVYHVKPRISRCAPRDILVRKPLTYLLLLLMIFLFMTLVILTVTLHPTTAITNKIIAL